MTRRLVLFILFVPTKLLNFLKFIFVKDFSLVRVILMHDIPKDSLHIFEKQIDHISKKWNFLTPDDFCEYVEGRKTLKGRNVLLTFDDGFKSNKDVALNILSKKNIKALFFVISDFVKLKDKDKQKEFITSKLYPEWRNIKLDESLLNEEPMSIDDLKLLISNGHSIGCHTSSHENLGIIEDEETLKYEIVDGANFLQRELEQEIKFFAYSFGELNSFSQKALDIARSRFDFIFTGMRGNNKQNNSASIRRDSLSIKDSLFEVSSIMEGSADFRYFSDLKELNSWID